MRPELKTPHPDSPRPFSGREPGNVGVVIVAHGDRGGDADRNKALQQHQATLADTGMFRCVTAGVLKGSPTLEDALHDACLLEPDAVAIYPFFMANGYFVKKVLRQRIAEFGLSIPHAFLQPLGLDPHLIDLVIREAVKTADLAEIVPQNARLLLVGHGSKFGPASANATRATAQQIAKQHAGVFERIEVAFLEEAPFLSDQLTASRQPTIVSGFFNGDGLHAGEDVPNAIKAAQCHAVYTGPIGLVPDVSGIIQSATRAAIAAE